MRIVAISDTHGRHNKIEVPDGNVLVVAGDFTMRGFRKEIESFNRWLGTLSHKHRVVISGNHELSMDPVTTHSVNINPKEARSLLTNCTYLEDSEVIIDGVKFYGSPWQPWFYDWAFNLRIGTLHEKWDKIPLDTDVLITHGPAWGVLDKVPGDEHVGCLELKNRISKLNLKLHIAGHLHYSYGEVTHPNGMISVNASTCNEAYQPVNPPIVIDI